MRRRARRSAQPLDRTNHSSKTEGSTWCSPYVLAAQSRKAANPSRQRPSRSVGCIARPSPRDKSQVRSRSWCLVIESAVKPSESQNQTVKVSVVAPLVQRRHSGSQLRGAPFDPMSRKWGIRQRNQWQGTQSASGTDGMCVLTNRWSGRVIDKVPSPNVGARAAQLNR